MRKIFNNLRFRSKIIWIFGLTFFFSMAISGISYYQYTSHDIEENFTVGAEDVLMQLADSLDLRLGVIRQRAHGMLTNYTFTVVLSNYLNNPSGDNLVKALGTVASYLVDLETGESLIHSTYIYTNEGEFDNFVRMRNWDFRFKESDYYKSFEKEPGKAIRWFPVRRDELFQDSDEVIPYVRQFSVQWYPGNQYLIIQLKKSELERLLTGKYEFFDKIVVLDPDGNTIVGSEDINTAELKKMADRREEGSSVITSEYVHQGETYMVTCEKLDENDWVVFGLRSKQTLLGSLKNLRTKILNMTGIVFLVGVVAILLLSHQLTASLRRLEKRMSCVQNGDFNVRFFYPYRDEVGNLAKSFNYMIGEIQSLVVKQEETIEELKRERDYVAEVQKQKRKAELKALQAQINPHFLYNTLNAITWQAAAQKADEISTLSSSLGRFFRISLSKGAEIISLNEELEHVTSYLDIQRIRYHSKLNYHIQIDEEFMNYKVIKLVLQPLAENSIYHGIKEKAGKGMIKIWAEHRLTQNGDSLLLTVWDNGAGIGTDKLEMMNEALNKGETVRSEGYGIFNVNERLRLYYGENYGLRYESEEGQWTKAILTLPVRHREVE